MDGGAHVCTTTPTSTTAEFSTQDQPSSGWRHEYIKSSPPFGITSINIQTAQSNTEDQSTTSQLYRTIIMANFSKASTGADVVKAFSQNVSGKTSK